MTSSGLVKMHAVAVALPPVAISVSSLRESAMRAGGRHAQGVRGQKKRGSKKKKIFEPFPIVEGNGIFSGPTTKIGVETHTGHGGRTGGMPGFVS